MIRSRNDARGRRQIPGVSPHAESAI